jgi:transcriptional regulator with GAF, ATPase, and Fis domain
MAEPPIVATQVDPYALEPAKERPVPRLTWTDSSGPHEVVIERGANVGSAPTSEVVVADRAVSRVHAFVELKDDGLWVRDVGSRNGTYVNGVKVADARIPNGGTLRVGTTEIKVAYGAPQAPKELWPEKSFGSLLGRTAVMRELFAQMGKMAPTNASILVTGETGTGKEVVARALHEASPRAEHPFVVVDCAALPPNLLESELFGHARGAFTGAVNQHEGAFEAADGGTVFLDEVGELPLALQPKLLRVLESRQIRRIGETQHRKVDVRVLSATHRDLRTMVNQGAFREDLFFRLAVLPLNVPPLRERLADLPLLLEGFLGTASREVTNEMIGKLMKLPWTGNVRELRNFAERVAAVGADRALAMATAPGDGESGITRLPGDEDIPTNPRAAVPTGDPSEDYVIEGGTTWFESGYKDFRDRWNDYGEREYLRRLMLRTNRQTSMASKEAGLDRTYLYRLLRRHNM